MSEGLAERKILKFTLQGYTLLIVGHEKIKTVQDLIIEFYDIVETYFETSMELIQQPMSIVRCARVAEEVVNFIQNAVVHFLSSIQTSREMCNATNRLLGAYCDLLKDLHLPTYETQKAALITMIDEASKAIDAGLGKLQKYCKEIKKVTGKLSTLKVYLHGPVGATILETVAAGVAEKKLVPGMMKSFGQVKSLLPKLKTTLMKSSAAVADEQEK